ncbi:MAG: redoxin domain-containing protein [Anaerolineales bacterium]|nr:redoxin domain-containing protein [Anaerolineales bacterium]
MAQLRDDFTKFDELDAVIAVVGPENADTFKNYWEENDLPFIGLPDPIHNVAKLYVQEVNLLRLGRMPALFIIDKNGLVRYAHYGKAMSDIPANQDVLGILGSLNQNSGGK